MTAYAAGDGRAFDELFGRLAPRIHAFFRRAFRDAATADDLMQITFMKLHRARDTYDPSRSVVPWLFSIAAAVRTDELRRRYREGIPAGPVDDDVDDGVDPASADRIRAVRAAIHRLPEPQRVVVQLHRYEGLTFEQIAAALGTTSGAVRVRASRAYERLRSDLAEELADGAKGAA